MKTSIFSYNKDFRNLFFGQAVSNIGTVLYSYIVGFYILQETSSVYFLGTYFAVVGVVEILFKYLISFAIENENKVKIVVRCDLIHGILMILGFLYFATIGKYKIYVLITISLMSSIINSVFTPAISSLYPLVLDKEDIKLGNSYRTMLGRMQLILGVGLSGLIYGIISIKYVMLINGISFILSAISEGQIKESYVVKNTKEKFSSLLKNGLNYVVKTPILLHYNILSTILNIYTTGYLTIFVRYVFLEYYGLREIYYTSTVIAYSVIIILTTYVINKVNMKEYSAIILGLVAQLMAIVISLVAIDHLFLFVIAVILANVGITLYNIPMVSKIMSEIDRQYMSRTIGTMSFISSITIPLSNYLYGLLIERYNIKLTLLFTLVILVISIAYVQFRREFKFNNNLPAAQV